MGISAWSWIGCSWYWSGVGSLDPDAIPLVEFSVALIVVPPCFVVQLHVADAAEVDAVGRRWIAESPNLFNVRQLLENLARELFDLVVSDI